VASCPLEPLLHDRSGFLSIVFFATETFSLLENHSRAVSLGHSARRVHLVHETLARLAKDILHASLLLQVATEARIALTHRPQVGGVGNCGSSDCRAIIVYNARMVLVDLQSRVAALVVRGLRLFLVTVVDCSVVAVEELLLEGSCIAHGDVSARFKRRSRPLLGFLRNHARLEEVCFVDVAHRIPPIFPLVVEPLQIRDDTVETGWLGVFDRLPLREHLLLFGDGGHLILDDSCHLTEREEEAAHIFFLVIDPQPVFNHFDHCWLQNVRHV